MKVKLQSLQNKLETFRKAKQFCDKTAQYITVSLFIKTMMQTQ